MQNNNLKTELFSNLAAQLQAEGATVENTEVVETQSVPPSPGRFSKFLSKIGGKFVTLVGKWAGIGFILFVTWAQAVPERTPIYVPADGKPAIGAAAHISPSLNLDLRGIDLSGSAQLWLAAFDSQRPALMIEPSPIYFPYVGDKIIYIVSGSSPPANYVLALTGSCAF